ncbi:MAG TPA: hypothetical protein DD490_27720, partial [Acidobacteria bacterium]|nr:hypothetical protein [Acidobacteriota bacterium]
MGKIRVQDLAKMMQISNQDLVFKLKSIGVRVEGDDAAIDTDIIQAILQGKKLPHPREVILRDEPAAPTPVSDPARRRAPAPVAAPARRPAANPLRPNRPRTLIQKVEPRIQTLPASERGGAPSQYLSPEALSSLAEDFEAQLGLEDYEHEEDEGGHPLPAYEPSPVIEDLEPPPPAAPAPPPPVVEAPPVAAAAPPEPVAPPAPVAAPAPP